MNHTSYDIYDNILLMTYDMVWWHDENMIISYDSIVPHIRQIIDRFMM